MLGPKSSELEQLEADLARRDAERLETLENRAAQIDRAAEEKISAVRIEWRAIGDTLAVEAGTLLCDSQIEGKAGEERRGVFQYVKADRLLRGADAIEQMDAPILILRQALDPSEEWRYSDPAGYPYLSIAAPAEIEPAVRPLDLDYDV